MLVLGADPPPGGGDHARPLWESDAAGREAQADLDALARPRDQHPHHGDPPLLGLESAVRAGAADFEPCGWMTRTLNAGVGTVIRLGYPTTAKAAQVSPTRPAWAAQDHVEPLLLALLHDLPTAEVRFGAELVGLEQNETHAVASVVDQGSGRIEHVQTSFVIGADGAHSAVRAALAIAMSGRDDLAEFQSVQFRAPLTDVVAEHRFGLNLIRHRDAAGVLAPRGRGDRWMYAREWHPVQDTSTPVPRNGWSN